MHTSCTLKGTLGNAVACARLLRAAPAPLLVADTAADAVAGCAMVDEAAAVCALLDACVASTSASLCSSSCSSCSSSSCGWG